MHLLETSFADPASNLACDEVLLDLCEQGALGPVLRLWTPSKPFVVLGYSNNASREVDLDVCRRLLLRCESCRARRCARCPSRTLA